MRATSQNHNVGRHVRAKFWLCGAVVSAVAACCLNAHAATLTVNSLLDDVFPDAAGTITPALTAPKCTLRMAIASANLDLAVGGTTNGCVAASGTGFLIAGADTIVFDPSLANGTIMLDASQGMNGSTATILRVAGPTTIDGTTATNITLDGGLSGATTTTLRIMSISEFTPSGGTSAGNSIWVNIYGIKFQNARVESAGACVFSVENLRLFAVEFTNCIATNTPTVATAAGGALFMRAADNAADSFRPDARLTRVTFRGNKALAGGSTTNPGGGAFFLGSSTGRMGNVVLTDVIVGGPNAADQNYADGGYGGGSITRAESVSITDSLFQGNVAQNSEVGGFRINSMSGEGAATIINSRFLDNRSKTGAGGLKLNNNFSSRVLLRDVVVTGNSAQNNGGADVNNNKSVTISNSSFSFNTASNNGGGLNVSGNTGAVALDDLTISGNRVTDGGSGGFTISGNTATVQIRRAAITNNQINKGTSGYAGNGGGGFFNNTSVLMSDSVVSGNTSDYHIAALSLNASFNATDGITGLPVSPLPPTTNSITLDRVTISGNTTTGAANGGSGYSMNYSSSPGIYSILNSTITGNVVTNGGEAGLSFQSFNPSSQTDATRVVIRNSTIARNTANGSEVAGFGSYNNAAPSSVNPFNGSITIESSVLGGRQAVTSGGNLIYAATPTAGTTINNNLFETNSHPYNTQCATNGNICNTDAKLEALASNGGPTQTLRLLPGSPAIKSGSNVTGQATDQRGATRPQGPGNDMGAYQTPAGGLTNCSLDMDGDTLVQANKEGLVLVRAMLGFSNATAVVGTGISQAQWASTKANLNANCGTSFTP